ncbi:AfsR/SARP family transcriptional regulator [Nocardiopsis sp. FR6]|uniref:AfsR/SARP family transcriptional regulator n=1 Tax=Nocardiopsis sp. FR6 TaxID=2605986 RepID=UPI0013588E57|nr:BTAD domain-containing putative transcriptional regulator [Nocardiopsis sp. FR6]
MDSNLPRVRYKLLGSVEAHVEGHPIDLGGPKRRTVLAALILQPDTVVPDIRLIDLVWGERPPRSARPQLQVHVHGLRKALGPDTTLRSACGYRMAVDAESTDHGVFERLLARACSERAADRLDEAALTLRSALSLWTGPALGGVEPALVAHTRAALEETRLHALEELYGVEIERGHGATAVPELLALCAEHPTDERFAGLLMSALHACGRTGEALEVYAALRERFANELGTDPGSRLQWLHLDLLAAGRDDGSRPRDLCRVRPAELPCGTGGFVGRSAELSRLDRALTCDRSPAVFLLTGVAGAGKTALALHWGHTVRERFHDGQLYVDLRGSAPEGAATRPDDALRQLLRSLGADPRRLPGHTSELAKLFRSLTADQRLLFLFDDAASVEQLTPLLPAGRGSVVLITSRYPLTEVVARFGAHHLPLDVLSRESSVELFRSLAGTAESAVVTRITDRCGRLPLALRLAAASHAVGEAGEPPGALALGAPS